MQSVLLASQMNKEANIVYAHLNKYEMKTENTNEKYS